MCIKFWLKIYASDCLFWYVNRITSSLVSNEATVTATTHMPSSTWTLPLDATNLSPVTSHTHNCVSIMCFHNLLLYIQPPCSNPWMWVIIIYFEYSLRSLDAYDIDMRMLIIVTVDWRNSIGCFSDSTTSPDLVLDTITESNLTSAKCALHCYNMVCEHCLQTHEWDICSL